MAQLVIRVKCPHCGHEQNTQSLKSVKCIYCNKSFSVFYKRKNKSNIVKIVKGNYFLLQKMLYKKGIFKKVV